MTRKVVFIVGPSAVGKSAAAYVLAQQCGGEIVNCDAMQVYREVNIACDKPTPLIRAKVPHWMVDVASVREPYDVAQYAALAKTRIDDILNRGKLPLVTGGSGMYISVLLDGIFDSADVDEGVRASLLEEASARGSVALHEELKLKDPAAAVKIHPNDVKRIIRALEVVVSTGKPISRLKGNRSGLMGKHDVRVIGLTLDRQELYKKAEQRVETMFSNGLVDEVKRLSQGLLGKTAAAMIGIKEVQGYLRGEYDLERAKYLLKRNTRHYIKRQMTWFRRDGRISWLDAGGKDAVTLAHEIEKRLE